ncbi:MAG: hypothetical protein HETSPECPRED_009633 [Heterodermia speciosa]|uniref:FAD dependent oxidoreductase domain-containing protein n=1 Tax=Heterodermia speciosa TaxID=116794 RepID=A0A8H3EQC0_9LECA|nr:MAG: hypothetical protein HETSPECPRED_009633 [Heterodermia speciosa]
MAPAQPSYLIVGAGIFGASTALHLKAAKPEARVTLLDRTPYPCPYGASFDLNKIVRDYYTDKFYMRLANEAQQEWRNGDMWKSFYHETGLFVADDTGMGRRIIQNYRDLHMDHSSEMIPPEEVGKRWNEVYKGADLNGVEEIFWNAGCGWADAAGALQHTVETAVESGVAYKEGEMASLLLDDSKTCHGLRLKDETELRADQTLLCTGAHTAKLLADSAPQWKELQINERMIATGVVAAYVRLTSQQMERFKGMPIYVGAMPDVKGGLLAPTPDGLMKIARDESFSHYVQHEASNQKISIPPESRSQTVWGQDVPQGLKDECNEVVRRSLGEKAEGLEIEAYRLCWDAFTPDQGLIISPHSHCRNLYFALGGSFHSWKLLPTIGSYIVQMLHGELEPGKAEKWAWDRVSEDGAHGKLQPKRDLVDIPGYSELMQQVSA